MTKLPIVDEFTEQGEVKRSAFLLLACVLTLIGLGCVMVYSAAATRSVALPTTRTSLAPLFSHAGKVAIAMSLLLLAAFSDYRAFARWNRVLYLVVLALLAIVLVPGLFREVNGSRRWLQVSFLPFVLQPSEFAKLAVILTLAAFIAKTPDPGGSFLKGFLPGALAILVPGILILFETDVGTFGLLSAIGFTLLLLAGAKLSHLLCLLVLGAPALVYALFTKLHYVRDRISSFGNVDPTSQQGFSLSALSVGGLFGMGLGAGRHKLGFLSEAENDFLFSVIGEELGFFGTSAVILLYAVLLWSGARILLGVRNRFGFFVVAGVLFTIAVQAVINIAVATGCTPVKGIPLPFLSSGGSSLCVLSLGVGLVLSIARHPDRSALDLGPRIRATEIGDAP